MRFVDAHCHIQFINYGLEPETVIEAAKEAGVTKLICAGCSLADSRLGIDMAAAHPNIYASVGIHPHEALLAIGNPEMLNSLAQLVPNKKVIAIGECGLDYYRHKPSSEQVKLLEFQIKLGSNK